MWCDAICDGIWWPITDRVWCDVILYGLKMMDFMGIDEMWCVGMWWYIMWFGLMRCDIWNMMECDVVWYYICGMMGCDGMRWDVACIIIRIRCNAPIRCVHPWFRGRISSYHGRGNWPVLNPDIFWGGGFLPALKSVNPHIKLKEAMHMTKLPRPRYVIFPIEHKV